MSPRFSRLEFSRFRVLKEYTRDLFSGDSVSTVTRYHKTFSARIK